MDLFNQPEETKDYTIFNNLTDYEKRCLITTNYWKVRNGEQEIDVPEEQEKYHRLWKIEKERALLHKSQIIS